MIKFIKQHPQWYELDYTAQSEFKIDFIQLKVEPRLSNWHLYLFEQLFQKQIGLQPSTVTVVTSYISKNHWIKSSLQLWPNNINFNDINQWVDQNIWSEHISICIKTMENILIKEISDLVIQYCLSHQNCESCIRYLLFRTK